MNATDAKLLEQLKAWLEGRKAEIAKRLQEVGGKPNLLLPADRNTYTFCVEIVQLIERVQFLHFVGATDDLPAATQELSSALKRSGFAAPES